MALETQKQLSLQINLANWLMFLSAPVGALKWINKDNFYTNSPPIPDFITKKMSQPCPQASRSHGNSHTAQILWEHFLFLQSSWDVVTPRPQASLTSSSRGG